MCIIEQWYLIHPNGVHELQERRHPCSDLHYHQPEVRTLQNEYAVISPTARARDSSSTSEVYEVIAPKHSQEVSESIKGKEPSKKVRDGFRLVFDWHIPFTSRNKKKKKPQSHVSCPVTPLVQPEPSPVTQSQPFVIPPYPAMRYTSSEWQYPAQYPAQYPRQYPPSHPWQSSREHPPPPPPPRVVSISPRLAEPHSVDPQARSLRTPAPVVETREHTRRPVPLSSSRRRGDSSNVPREHTRRPLQRAPSPPRQNHTESRLRQITEHLQQLERDLNNARTAARRERAANILREMEIQRLRRDREVENERMQLEPEESNVRYERGRRNRLSGRDGQPSVEIHQFHDDREDRGSRVLAQAVRDRHIRETGRSGTTTGLTRRATVDERRGQRNRRAGEEIIWDDDVRRVGQRFI